MNTVIDKDLAIQLEYVYIEKRIYEILPDDSRYQIAGRYMERRG